MLTIFWDVNGPILVHFREKGQTVISARNNDMLVNELKSAIPSKHRELPSKRVLLLHDNVRPPYGCAYSGYTSCSEIWGVETSTIHSGLGAIGLSLVWPYERTFAGPEVCRWQRGNRGGAKLVTDHAKSFFLEGIRKLVERWTKCVAKQGDYVEKQDTNNFYKYSCKKVIIKFLLFNDLPSYLMFLWPCIMNWPNKTTNVMHWILFIRQILLLSSTCFEYQVLIFRRTYLYISSIWYRHSL